jgi:hypothetical protein
LNSLCNPSIEAMFAEASAVCAVCVQLRLHT